MISEKVRKTPFGKRLKAELTASRSHRAEVNVGKIGQLTKKGDTIVVPGKVLGSGSIAHAVTVAAEKFSGSARKKIESAGGKAIPIGELHDKAARVMR